MSNQLKITLKSSKITKTLDSHTMKRKSLGLLKITKIKTKTIQLKKKLKQC